MKRKTENGLYYCKPSDDEEQKMTPVVSRLHGYDLHSKKDKPSVVEKLRLYVRLYLDIARMMFRFRARRIWVRAAPTIHSRRLFGHGVFVHRLRARIVYLPLLGVDKDLPVERERVK